MQALPKSSLPRDLYIDLLKRALSNTIYVEPEGHISPELLDKAKRALVSVKALYGKELAVSNSPMSQLIRMNDINMLAGSMRAMQSFAHTMTDQTGIANVEQCVRTVVEEKIPGDLLEAGVWQGGLTILMRGVLKAYGVTERVVWVADSFQGLPEPSDESGLDDKIAYHFTSYVGLLAVSLEKVRHNFSVYGLLDDQVRFLEGFFCDTLPTAPVGPLALMRLDGDWYDSTRDSLVNLYPKLQPSGYCIIDDYGLPLGCRKAVDDYRAEHRITEPIVWVNDQTVYWRRAK